MSNKYPIQYTVNCDNPKTHLFEVCCLILSPDKNGQLLSLPNWIPGSYMIRDFSKNIVKISATNTSGNVELIKINKNTWKCAQSSSQITVKYTVYAFDLSVRSAHFDSSHAFFNGTSLFLKAHGFEQSACSIKITIPVGEQFKNWKIASTLAPQSLKKYEFGFYQAENYDELIDHPVEIGEFKTISFSPYNIHHQIIFTGRYKTDAQKLAEDLTQICTTHIDLFGELPDIEQYLFLTTVVSNGYGGLEHRSSTSLICSRKSLINNPDKDITKEYRQFLALCSHEYFHTWNVKRIKPRAYMPYNLDEEVHTQQLWAFEGITSYYDELTLIRANVITISSYLELLSQTITRVIRQQGRFVQSVAESSFDAWTKFYKQDENANNAIISYYTKGTLIALALDFEIRIRSNNNLSLDDIMRFLWQNYGKKNIGLKEGEIESIINKFTKSDFTDFFNRYLYGKEDPPLEKLLDSAGILIEFRIADNQNDLGGIENKSVVTEKISLGIKTRSNNDSIFVQQIFNGGCAELAGLNVNDELVSFDGYKISSSNYEDLLSNYQQNENIEVYVFRRDELFKFNITLQSAAFDTCVLLINKNSSVEQNKFRDNWLHKNIQTS